MLISINPDAHLSENGVISLYMQIQQHWFQLSVPDGEGGDCKH